MFYTIILNVGHTKQNRCLQTQTILLYFKVVHQQVLKIQECLQGVSKTETFNAIENEHHFLFDCSKHITYRTSLHNLHILQEANIYGANFTDKMKILLSSCNTITILAKYIEVSLTNIIFKLRQSYSMILFHFLCHGSDIIVTSCMYFVICMFCLF